MNIVLIGYRCCGKTSTGRLLADKLGRQFIDTDDLIIQNAGCNIDEIVSRYGWQHFREIERSVVKDISSMGNHVIATGGGVILNGENIKHLKTNGFIIWLYTDISTIKKRMNEDKTSPENRPSLTGDDPSDEIKKVLEQRNPLYLKASDLSIDTTNTEIDKVAEMIVEKMRKQEIENRK